MFKAEMSSWNVKIKKLTEKSRLRGWSWMVEANGGGWMLRLKSGWRNRGREVEVKWLRPNGWDRMVEMKDAFLQRGWRVFLKNVRRPIVKMMPY